MNSFKCRACGLVNWATETECKRCGQSLLATQDSAISSMRQPQAPYQANYAAAVAAPAGFAPPPPTVYGDEVGDALAGTTPVRHATIPQSNQTRLYQLTADEKEELEKAKKAIKSAGYTGIALIVFNILSAGVMFLRADSEVMADGGGAILGIITIVILGFIGGLTFGTFMKSRVCAVLLLLMTVLDRLLVVTSSSGKIGIFTAIFFILSVSQGVIGAFKYHKMKEQYPLLVD